MVNTRLMEKKIYETWAPRIEKKLKAKNIKISESKLQILTKMCHTRKVFEASSVAAIPGRGNFAFGNNPSTGNAGFYGTPGSAEVLQNLFGIFVEVAAANVGMELVPLIPMSKSSGSIYIAEPIYGNGVIDSAANKPLLIQVKKTTTGSPTALVVGTAYTVKTANSGGENIMLMTYVGVHRINGNAMFKVGVQYDNSGSAGTNWQAATLATCLDTAVNGAGIYTSAGNFFGFTTGTVDYVAGMTNFIAGYSGAGLNDTDAWFANRGTGTRYGKPMSRQTGEKTTYRSLGLRTWNRNFSADTVHVDIEYTTEQIQDMMQDHGMSALDFGDSMMQDQLNQHINEHILGTLFALGWSNHYTMNQLNGFNLNTFMGASSGNGSAQTFLGKDDTSLTISGPAGVLPGTGAISENLSTLQRRVISRLLYASNIINNRSRRGRGDQAVLNTMFSTAIQDIRGFQAAPFDNDVQSSGLTMIGSLYNIRIYEDPLMETSDARINVSRKGTDKDPGLKMCPYILAEKISTISADSMAPKEALKSRYSLVAAGTSPELNSMTFTVQTDSGYAII